jgi:hypothetical protein
MSTGITSTMISSVPTICQMGGSTGIHRYTSFVQLHCKKGYRVSRPQAGCH